MRVQHLQREDTIYRPTAWYCGCNIRHNRGEITLLYTAMPCIMSMEEAGVLVRIKMKYDNLKQTITTRTAMILWLQYMNMLAILQMIVSKLSIT